MRARGSIFALSEHIVTSTTAEMTDLERRNEEFWDELCGTGMARALGLVGNSRETLEAFDRAYISYYPYLLAYLDQFDLRGKRVLEIGLGYGTLGEAIVRRSAVYHGLDIAPGPVRMMQHRLQMLGGATSDAGVTQGSATAIPYPDGDFDFVYSIGCLHHTGDLSGSVNEVRRVLRPGGIAVVMLYHSKSARQLWHRRLARLRGKRRPTQSDLAHLYDEDSAGATAPHTDFVSRSEVRRLFSGFRHVRIETKNFEDIRVRRRLVIPRMRILGTPIEALLGLDLYITARR